MCLEKLQKIEVKEFNFKNQPDKKLIGFIAQELYEIFPEAVIKGGENPETEPWKIDYLQIIPLLVNSVKELNEKVKNLEKKLDECLKSS